MQRNSVRIRFGSSVIAAISFSVCVTVCVIIVCAAGAYSRLYAQTSPTIILAARSLDSSANAFGFSGLRHFDAETLPWRFHAGDNAERSSPLYDDAAWTRSAPSLATNYNNWSPDLRKESIGWFRARIGVDASLHRRPIAFALALTGAAEVYLDGNLVAQFGAPAARAAEEKLPIYARFLLRPTTIRLDSGRSYLLAVRYSFARFAGYERYFFHWMPTQDPALRTAFLSVDAAEEYRRAAFATVIQFGSCFGMPLLAAILHFALFLFYRRDKANLYVACFSLCSSALALSFALASHVMGQSFFVAVWAQLAVYIFFICIPLTLWFVASSLFFAEMLRFRGIFLAASILCFVGIMTVAFISESFQTVAVMFFVALGLLPCFSAFVLVLRAMRQKLDGSCLFGVAIGVCITAWLLEVALVISGVFYAARPLWIAVFIRFGIYIAIPLALAVLLARRAALQSAALAEQNERLEERVAKRTEDLRIMNAELQRQNFRLEEVNTEKNNILGIVSHDLKNPINAAHGFAEFITTSASTLDEARLAAGHIVQTSDRMLQLVKNILDFNRVEAGGMNFDVVTFDIAAAVEHALYDYRQAALEKRIELVYENEPAAAAEASGASRGTYIYADEQAVAQIIDNLVSNAVKYSPFGATVRLRLRERVQTSEDGASALPTRFIRLEVEDAGPGVSEEDRSRLFQKFIKLSAQPTGGEHSTGLGLSIAKSLADAMNARLWCEPFVYGKGAVFVLEFQSAPVREE